MAALEALNEAVVACRRCPRLVAWREQVAREKRAAYRDWDYWGRPMQGFGDPAARVLILGLAPAAHGGNRTGRIFTGDRSGDFLFASLHRTGLRESGRVDPARGRARAERRLHRRRGPLRAARQPADAGASGRTARSGSRARSRCCRTVHVVVCLGGFAWESALRLRAALAREPMPRPKPKFGHGVVADGSPWPLLGCFHPSQQNTFTGKLTPPMMDGVFEQARALAWGA